MRIRFKVLSSTLKGLEFQTDKETVRIGRSSKNDLVLKQPSVSRFHARILVGNGDATLEDAGSRNLTRVDGQEVRRPTAFKDNSVLLFGDVAVSVTFPDLAQAPQEDTEETPPAGALIPGLGGNSRAPERAAGPLAAAIPGSSDLSVADGRREALQRRVWPALALVLGLAAAVALTVLFLGRVSGGPRTELGVVLRVDDDRVVEVPWGFVYHPEVENSDVARVKRPLNLDLAVQVAGRSQGLTRVKLFSGEGKEHIILHVKVMPRGLEAAERELTDQVRSDEERLLLAREEMKRGDALRRQADVYEAMQRYGRALALLEPFIQNPNWEYDQARRRYEEAEQEVQNRYDQLTLEMSGFIKDGDRPVALERLAQIKELIPDETDVRRQNADLLFRLLQRMITRARG